MADSSSVNVSYVYLFSPTFQFMNVSGKPLADGYIEVYISGTRSKYYACSDFEGTLHPFKIPLNALGSAVVLVSPAHSYDVYVYNSLGVLQMSRYNITPATGEGTVITDVTTITSTDDTVEITANSSTEYDLSVARALQNTSDSVLASANGYTDSALASGLSDKKDKQTALEFSGSATKTIKKIAQNSDGVMSVEFEDIDLPQEVPNVNVTSTDSSITVNTSIDPDTNTKTFDLSVANEAEVEYGRFIASDVTATATLRKTRGNLELSSNKIQLKKRTLYHFTIRGTYVATTLSNTLSTLAFIEYSTFNLIHINVDNSISDNQFFEISFDVYASNDISYPVGFSGMLNAKVSSLEVDVHSVVASSSGGGGGGPIYVAHDGTMTGDGTDENPLSIQSALDVSNANTAPKYDPTATYPTIGTLCTYGNVLYRSKVAINSAEEWNEEHWKIDSVAAELEELKVPPMWENIASKLGNYSGTSTLAGEQRIIIDYSRKLGLLYFRGYVTPTSSGNNIKIFSFNTDIVRFSTGEFYVKSGNNVVYVSLNPYDVTTNFRMPYSITARDVKYYQNLEFQFICPLSISVEEFEAYLASH